MRAQAVAPSALRTDTPKQVERKRAGGPSVGGRSVAAVGTARPAPARDEGLRGAFGTARRTPSRCRPPAPGDRRSAVGPPPGPPARAGLPPIGAEGLRVSTALDAGPPRRPTTPATVL